MSLYAISSTIFEDDDQVAYVHFWDDLLHQPVKLWHLQPECWSVEVLITLAEKTIDVFIVFDDFELNYTYRSNHSSPPDFAIVIPLYFEYPFEVARKLQLTVAVEELKQLPLPGFRTVTY